MAKEKKNIVKLPTAEDVRKFDMLYPMINSNLLEVRELSKKKQDEPLNKFKVNAINKKLIQAKEILRDEPANEFLELLDEDTFPSNSDAVLMISQFIKVLDQYKHKYYTSDGNTLGILYGSRNTWKTEG
jgi:hypothetical protein